MSLFEYNCNEREKEFSLENEQPSSPSGALKAAIKQCSDKSQLLSLWRRNSHAFLPAHCDQWLRRVPHILKGKHLWADREITGVFQEVAERLLQSTGQDSWCFSGLLWAAAKSHYTGLAGVKQRVEERLLSGAYLLEPVDTSLMLWAYSQKVVGRPARGVLEVLIGTVKDSAETFEPVGIATTLWSLAKLGAIDYFRFAEKALRPMILHHRAAFEAQNVSNILWAYASTGYKPEKTVLQGLVEQAKDLSTRGEFNGQAVANTLWALSKLNAPSEFREVEEAVRPVLTAKSPKEQCKPQEMSNILWSFATLRICPEAPVLRSFLDYLHSRAFECNQSDIAFFFGAFAKLGLPAEFLEVESVLTPVLLHLADFQSHAISNILQAHGELRIEPDARLVSAMFGNAPRKVQEFRPQDTVQCLLAFADLGLVPPAPVLIALVQSVASIAAGCTHRHAASCSYALGILARCLAPEFLLGSPWLRIAVDALSHRLGDLSANGFGDEEHAQLFLAYLLFRSVPGCQLALPHVVLARAEITWRHRELAHDGRGAAELQQSDVTRTLQQLGMEPETQGATTDDQLLRVPLAVQISGARVAVEVLGPAAFTMKSLALTGATLVRRFLLEERGWNVLIVPSYHWTTLWTDYDKQAFLSSLLSALIATPRPSDDATSAPGAGARANLTGARTSPTTHSPTFSPEVSRYSLGAPNAAFPSFAMPNAAPPMSAMPAMIGGAPTPTAAQIESYLMNQSQLDLLARLTMLSMQGGGAPQMYPGQGMNGPSFTSPYFVG